MAHQWLIRLEAVDLWPHRGPKVLCGYPDCPGAADYTLTFPSQEPTLRCTEHAFTSIHRAMGQDVTLEAVLGATRARDATVRRTRGRHIHWPVGGRVDGLTGGRKRNPPAGRGGLWGLPAGEVLRYRPVRGDLPTVQEAFGPRNARTPAPTGVPEYLGGALNKKARLN